MAFALNNPVSFNDPTGLMATDGEGELPVLYVPEVTIYANKDEETKGEETTSTDNIQDDKKRFADEYSSSWNPIYRNIALEFKKGNLNYVADANRKGTKIRWGAASLHSRFMREIHYLSEMMAVGVIGMTALMVAAPAIAELIAMDAAVDIASIGVDVATGNYADAAIDAGALLVPGVNAAEVKAGIKISEGLEIIGFTKHGLDRAIERGIKPFAIIDALRNPLKTGKIVTDKAGRQSQRFIGRDGEVVINPQTGLIVSVNPTSSSKVAKLLRDFEK
jgi:hypothetical protein